MIELSAKFCHLGLGWFDDHAGGLERYQHGICVAHARSGLDVHALVLSRKTELQSPDYQAIRYASPADSRRHRTIKLRDQLASWMGDETCDAKVLISHHASVSGPILDLIERFKMHGGEFVVQFQGPWADESRAEGAGRLKTAMQRRMERQVYQSADRILTLSDAFCDLVVDRYDVQRSRVFTVPGAIDSITADAGVDRLEARRRLGWPIDSPTLVCVRRLVRRVGVDVLIQAMKQVARAVPNVRLMIGGKGPLMSELQKEIKRAKLQDSIVLMGFVSDQQLPLVYAAADLSVVPTQSLEGFGLVTLESMACGTPAVVTPVGSLPEVMNPLKPALVLDGNEAESIASGLIRLLHDRGKLPSEKECRRYVRDNFDWNVIAPRVLRVYTGHVPTQPRSATN